MISERVEEAILVDGVEIEAMVRVVARVERVSGTIVGWALKEPVAIVVRSATGTWRVPVDDRSEVPR
jgi:hypothetical protein